MNPLHQEPVENLEHQQLPKVRHELQVFPQIYNHQPFWVIKDPVTLRYYRFNREEYFVIEQLRQGVTLEELKDAHRREFRTDCLNNQDIAAFVRTLISKGLINSRRPDRDDMLYQRHHKRWRTKLMSQMTSIMFFKIPLFDPDKILTAIHKRAAFVWSWPFFLIYLVLLGVGAGLIVHRWEDFSEMYSHHFFTIYNLPILMLTIWIVKAFHEFGHGLTCKNYGGEVHEMGWLFMVFMPFFYCNVTDSWTFPSKRHRVLVTSGGIMTELIFAGLAALGWYFTSPPSFFNAFCFNIVIACSFSTIVFNANPLLKYDGYYILMDLIEVPNLRQRSSTFMQNLFVRYILGGQPLEADEENRFRWMFPFYSIAAFVYRWFIMIYILFVVYHMLERIHLAWVGQLLAVFSIGTMMLFPLINSGRSLAANRVAMGISSSRLLLWLALLVVGAAVVLFYPMQQSVMLNFILEPASIQWVRPGVDGELVWQDAVAEGAALRVENGEAPLLAVLENPDLRLELTRIEKQIEQIKIEFYYAQSLGLTTQAEQLRDRHQSFLREQERLQSQVNQLEVRLAFSGEILSTRQELRVNDGRYVPRGTPVLLLAGQRELTAKVWVTEKTFARIFKSRETHTRSAELMLYAFAAQTFDGEIREVPNLQPEESMGEFGEKLALSQKVGGEVLTEYDPVAKRERPQEPVYEVTIHLDQEALPPFALPYMSGRVRIDCGKSTLFQWGRDSVLRLISPEVRL